MAPSASILKMVLDFETLQIGAQAAKGVVVHQEARVVEGFFGLLDDAWKPAGREFHSLIGRTAEEVAEESAKKSISIHGISAEEILAAPPEERFVAGLQDFLDETLAAHPAGSKFQIVGHNVNKFDIPILKRMLGEEKYSKYFAEEAVDTLDMARKYGQKNPVLQNHKLETVFDVLSGKRNEAGDVARVYGDYSGFVDEASHRARGDAYKSGFIAQYMYPSTGYVKVPATTFAVPPAVKPEAFMTTEMKLVGGLVGLSLLTREQDPEYIGEDEGMPPEGIRQSYPTNPGQFEGMNPHPGYDFPGGRTQHYNGPTRQVNTSPQAINSRVAGQRDKLTFHPSGAFQPRKRPSKGNVGSRRERG